MAFSSSEGKEFFRDWLNHVARPLGFKRFLDVGCGAGLYGKIIREVFGPEVIIDAIEVFPDYIFRFDLPSIYNEIYIEDIRVFMDQVEDYDLIIAGDILEHLTKTDAVRVVDGLRPQCRFFWAALPVKIGRPWSVGYQQPENEYEENPANRHLHDWTGAEIIEEFKPLWVVPFLMTGSFLVEGDIR
jgi:2-polyprenyl-3-methyl-5-hydroxy-6-metoxy-1,4-benzoquinol methylase